MTAPIDRNTPEYSIKPTTVRIGASTPKGYQREDLHDAWLRYLGPPPYESATSATSATETSGMTVEGEL